ncbi:protein of unknown function [Paraburkholderia kururiensis]
MNQGNTALSAAARMDSCYLNGKECREAGFREHGNVTVGYRAPHGQTGKSGKEKCSNCQST